MAPTPQPDRKPNGSQNRPWVSLSLTAMLAGLTVQDQLTSGSIDTPLLIVDVILIGFWLGQPLDKLLTRLLGR